MKRKKQKILEKAFGLVNNSLFAPGANEHVLHVMNDILFGSSVNRFVLDKTFFPPQTLSIESDLQNGAGSSFSEGNSNGKQWLGVTTQQHVWLLTENDVL